MEKTVLLSLAALALTAPEAAAKDVTGLWITEGGEGAVEIVRCGDRRCGRIVWLKEPYDAAGRPMRDIKNPSPAARQRPVCGIEVLRNVQLQDDGTWDGGSIYDRRKGKTYKVMLKPNGDDRLEVRGYVGVKSMGDGVIWSRSTADLKRCQPATALPRTQ